MGHARARRAATGAAVVLAVVTVLVAAARPPQTPAGGGAAPVVIDFRVVTVDGRTVQDLELNSLTLKVDGRVREIASLEVVQSGGVSGERVEGTLPLPYVTNDVSAAGRDTMFVIDDESFPPGKEPPVKNAVTQILSGLSPGDRAGLMTLPIPSVNLTITGDLATIRAAASKLVGRQIRAESTDDTACRTRLNLEALKNLFRGLSGEPLTTVVLLSAGLTPPAAATHRPGTQPPTCEVRSQEYQDVAAAAAGAAISLYVIQIPQDVGESTTVSNSLLAGLESLAAVAGGESLRLADKGGNAAARVLAETAARYRLTFDPDPSDRNGGSHPVELQVSRDRTRVHAPGRVTIPKAGGPLFSRAGTNAMDILRANTLRRDVLLLLAGHSSRNPGDGRIKVVALAEPLSPSVALASATVGLFDGKGILRAQATLPPADLGKRPMVAALVVPPGSYRLRLAATDASGQGGSVDENLRAGLAPAGPMTLSSIVLGVLQEGTFVPRLRFSDEPAAIVYFEIYGVPQTGQLSGAIEVADSESGPALVTGPAGIRPGAGADSRIVMSTISLGGLAPGDILVRATVSLDGQPIGRASRTLRKEAR